MLRTVSYLTGARARSVGTRSQVTSHAIVLYNGILEKPKGDDSDDWEPREQLLFKSSAMLDDQDRAFKKSNGEWTYFANDAAYHLDKYNRKFDQLINIWGADHVGYIPRMKSVLKTISNKDDYLEVVTCQIVRLIKNNQILKMSKREGNFITLQEVYDQVGKDPLRYFMVLASSSARRCAASAASRPSASF